MVSRMYPRPVKPQGKTTEHATKHVAERSGLDGASGQPDPTSTIRDFPEISGATTQSAPTVQALTTQQRVSPPIRTTGQTKAVLQHVTPPPSVPAPFIRPELPTPELATPGPVATLTRPESGPATSAELGAGPLLDADLSPRFRFDPVAEGGVERRASWGRKTVQGTMLLGLIAAIGAFVLLLPQTEDGQEIEAAASQVETVDSPAAVAEFADRSDQTEIEGSLGDTAGFGEPSAFAAPTPGTPADGESFGLAVTESVAGDLAIPEAATTTTTVWVEPVLPPESEWVDAGYGVLVPDLQLRIRFCESTNNYLASVAGSSARGAYQFIIGSWEFYGHAAVTGVPEAHLASPAEQDQAALRTLQDVGTGPWAESRPCWSDPDIDPRYATASPPQPTTPEEPTATTVPVGEDEGETDEPEATTTTTTAEDSSESDTTTEDSSSDSSDSSSDPFGSSDASNDSSDSSDSSNDSSDSSDSSDDSSNDSSADSSDSSSDSSDSSSDSSDSSGDSSSESSDSSSGSSDSSGDSSSESSSSS